MHKLTKWLNKRASKILLVFLITSPVLSFAQPVKPFTLEQVYELARQNYPLIKQKDLLQRSGFLNIENIKTSFLPQISFTGQASYQSDVTNIPISLPNIQITPLSKDQYKVWADVNQLLYDGGVNKTQQKLQQISTVIDDQKLEVELYKLKDRINQLYLGILLLDAQLKQTNLLKEDIGIGRKTVTAQVENGTAFKSAALVLEAQLLQTDQRAIEIKANRKTLLDVMSLFINQSLSEDTELITPVVEEKGPDMTILRPELKLYSYQDSLWKIQNKLITSKNLPKASLFAQGGYGKPALNQLKDEFALYYIGGVKLNWSLSGLYTAKREKQIISVNEKINDVQKDVFLFNTNTQLIQQQSEIEKIKKLVESDDQILSIRAKITEASKAQLQNAVITSNDYLREVNAADQSSLSLLAHQIQLLQAKINYQNIKGNQ
jgi:outer membrane protein TolC